MKSPSQRLELSVTIFRIIEYGKAARGVYAFRKRWQPSVREASGCRPNGTIAKIKIPQKKNATSNTAPQPATMEERVGGIRRTKVSHLVDDAEAGLGLELRPPVGRGGVHVEAAGAAVPLRAEESAAIVRGCREGGRGRGMRRGERDGLLSRSPQRRSPSPPLSPPQHLYPISV